MTEAMLGDVSGTVPLGPCSVADRDVMQDDSVP